MAGCYSSGSSSGGATTASSMRHPPIYMLYCVLVMMVFLQLTACQLAQADKFPKVEAFFQGHCNELSPCHQKCVDLPNGGFECACKKGYKLHSNGFSCELKALRSGNAEEGDASSSSTSPVTNNDLSNMDDVTKESSIDGDLPEMATLEPVESLYRDEELSWDAIFKARSTKLPKHKAQKDPNAWDAAMLGDDPMVHGGDPSMDNNNPSGMGVLDADDIEKRRKGDDDRKHKGRGGRRKNGKKGRKAGRKNKTKSGVLPSELADSATVGNTGEQQPAALANREGNEENSNYIYEDTKAPPVKFTSCSELRCYAGGRCVPDEMRGGVRCQCMLGNTGEFCEQDIVVRYPKFVGTGYIAFPVLRGAYKEFTITVEFRPETSNGLLMFSAEHHNARSDFFSISLIDGHAEFRFDCGTGPAHITSENVVELGQWNTITVHRNDWNGWIQLNDGPQAKGRSKGLYSRITFREDLYLGGYTNTSLIGERTGMRWGFVGCVRKLEINNRRYDMRKGAFVGDAIHGVDVGECSSHVCSNVKCQNGGSCVADSADSHVCLCPLGTAGDRCENRIDIQVTSFSGNSYLQFIGLRRTVLSFTEVEIVFKAEHHTGLLLYNGYTTDGSGDFISVSLSDGYLEYRFDLGTGPAIIRSRQPVTLHEWHVVRVSRTGRDGYLQIDNQAAIEGMSKGAYTQLTLTLDLFVGGHRNFDEVAKNAMIKDSFIGCIQKVVINERPLKLLEEAIDGVNIDNCNHPCTGQPCLNGGRCVPIRDFYKCSCPLGFENTNCEDKLKEPIRIPMFSGESYLQYLDPFIAQRVRGKKIDIQMRIRALGRDGMIFWTGEEKMTSSSDFLALGLKDGHVQFSYNLGSGEVVITYNESRIDDGKWHKIRAQRYERVGYLEIDGTEVIEGTSPGRLKQLNTQSKIFVGGMEDIVLSTKKRFKSGFVGCVSNITLATDYHIDLIGEAVEGQNIQQCS